jgi:autotransporter-associated beta strand protein
MPTIITNCGTRRFASLRTAALAALAMTMLGASPTFGQSTWVGNASNLWSNAGNWSTGIADNFNTSLVFEGSTNPATSNDLLSGTATGITFNAGAAAFTLSGNSITLPGSITNSSTGVAQTISLPMVLTSASRNVTTGSGGTTILSGNISGGVSSPSATVLVASSTGGVLTLSGSNSFTGLIEMRGGTFNIGSAFAMPATATLAAGNNNPLFNNTSGADLTLGSNFRATGSSPTFIGTNNITSTGTFTFGNATTRDFTIQSGTFTIATLAQTNAAANLRKRGSGTLVVTSSASNLVTSNTVSLDGGLLLLGHGNALGTARMAVTSTSAILGITNAVTDADLTTLLGTGTFIANSRLGFDTTAGNRTYASSLSGVQGLAKLGSNALTLSASNSYTGPTTISAGSLVVGTNNAIPSTSAVSVAGSTLTVGGFSNAIGSLATSGNSAINVSINGGSAGSLSMTNLTFGGGTNTLALSMTSATAGIYNVLTYSGNKTGSVAATGLDANYTLLQGPASNGSVAVQRKADLGAVSASAASPTIITGGSSAIRYTVQNLTPSGGASLSFASTNVANVFGTSSGSAAALATSGSVAGLFFTGTGIGLNQQATFTVSDPLAINTTGTGSVSLSVLDHATPGFVGISSSLTNLVLDFGTVAPGASQQSLAYSLTNIASSFGSNLTAGLALTSFQFDSGDNVFGTDLATFANLAAGNTSGYSALFTPTTSGSFSGVYRLSFADQQDLSGAASLRDLTVTMQAVVVPEPGAIILAVIGIAAAAWKARRRTLELRRHV